MSVFKKYVSHEGATGYCPECKEAISKEANICPHCRSNLKENEAWQQAKASGGCAPLIAFAFIGAVAIVYTANCILA